MTAIIYKRMSKA